MAGFLMNLCIRGATIFVDDYSDYVFVALMRNLKLDKMLLATSSFERHANKGSISIISYGADNGKFADTGFQQAIKDSNQEITYCTVGAHHQHRIVEWQIKELTLISRTLLLHAKQHWPNYISTMMWPFALKEAAYCLNWLSLRSDGQSCEATFFNVDKEFIDPSIYCTFGSPCFVLDSCLQPGIGGAPKWEPRSCLGIYVGHSPSHIGLVALVLNQQTGHVSPQYHVVFDDQFTIVLSMEKNEVPPNWAQLVKNSTEKVTKEHCELAKTWRFPDPELGDISMPERNPANHNKSDKTPSEQETFTHSNIFSSMLSTGTQSPSCMDPSSSTAPRISQQDYFPDPLLSEHLLSFPPLFNLETLSLRQSPRIAALNETTQDNPAIVAYTSSPTQLNHDGSQDQNQSCLFSLSLPWLVLDGTLQPQSLIQTMSIFFLLPKIANYFE